jgi:regulator of nonsense transcripts 3
LAVVIKQHNFQDAKNTSKDPCLLGPPSLEFAPYGRIPGSRVRKDGRQGTIDQDPEFIDFLQSLTEPVARATFNGESGEGTDAKPAKITTTPLVEYLKEKKLNKAKESAASKTAKPQGKPEAKEAKTEKVDPKKMTVAKKETQRSPEKIKVEKATQDAVKAVNKSVAAMKSKTDVSEPVTPPPKAAAAAPTTVKRERERGSASVAAKILQRDLGLVPPRGERRVSRAANPAPKPAGSVEKESKTVPASPAKPSSDKVPDSTTSIAPPQSGTSSPNVPIVPPTGPRINKSPAPTAQAIKRPLSVPSARPSRRPPSPGAGAKSAFLKHANFSQGVTEELLQLAFSTFGVVTRCEIDRKKGFGYVDFEDRESLKKAMLASPVKIGDKGGQVVVLENRNLRAKAQTPIQQPAPSESKVLSQPQPPQITAPKIETVADTPQTSPPTATPTAPRGAHVPFRGGAQHHVSRGGHLGPRGGFSRGGRGGRANFRGRGTFDAPRGGGHANVKNTSGSSASLPTAPPTSSSAADAKSDGPQH